MYSSPLSPAPIKRVKFFYLSPFPAWDQESCYTFVQQIKKPSRVTSTLGDGLHNDGVRRFNRIISGPLMQSVGGFFVFRCRMIALYTFVPLFCPGCGTPTRLDQADNPEVARFNAFQALNCPVCGTMYQKVRRALAFRAAVASEGDLLEYYRNEKPEGE